MSFLDSLRTLHADTAAIDKAWDDWTAASCDTEHGTDEEIARLDRARQVYLDTRAQTSRAARLVRPFIN